MLRHISGCRCHPMTPPGKIPVPDALGVAVGDPDGVAVVVPNKCRQKLRLPGLKKPNLHRGCQCFPIDNGAVKIMATVHTVRPTWSPFCHILLPPSQGQMGRRPGPEDQMGRRPSHHTPVPDGDGVAVGDPDGVAVALRVSVVVAGRQTKHETQTQSVMTTCTSTVAASSQKKTSALLTDDPTKQTNMRTLTDEYLEPFATTHPCELCAISMIPTEQTLGFRYPTSSRPECWAQRQSHRWDANPCPLAPNTPVPDAVGVVVGDADGVTVALRVLVMEAERQTKEIPCVQAGAGQRAKPG